MLCVMYCVDEFDVVGTVGRSTGLLKVPLLVEPGEAAGTAILCAHVLALMDWDTGLPLYRHPRWQPPELRILHREELVAAHVPVASGEGLADGVVGEDLPVVERFEIGRVGHGVPVK